MKRILSVVLTLALLLGVFGGMPAMAAGTVDFFVSSATASRGDTVTITVELKANVGFCSMSIIPTYDKTALTLIKAESTQDKIADVSQGSLNIIVYTSNGNDTSETGVLFTMNFKVNDNAAITTHTVNLSVKECFNAAGEDVPVNVTAGRISVVCEHSYGSKTNVDGNNHKQVCSKCGGEKLEAHSWGTGVETTPATCQKTGVKTFTCSDCSATKTEDIAKKPHTWGNWTKVDDNEHKRTCTACKTETETSTHRWDSGKVTTPATCKDTGIRTYTCSVCNGTKTETIPVDPDAHSFGTWTKLDNDKHERTCTICKTEKEQENHNKQDGMVTTAATCVAEGEKTYTCSVCSGTTVEKLPVDPAAHKLGSWANLDADKHAQSCTLCSTVQKQENHKWDEGKVSKDSTCKEVGVKTYTCATCKATKTEEIPIKEHTFGKWESISDSQHKRTCTMCKTETETAEHKFTEGDNWTKDEKQHYHVCECGMKKDAADHVPGPEATEKDPQICTICKYIIKPALGHTHTWDTKLTTDETGHWYDCPGCEDKKDFKEHDFANDCDGLCETCQYTRTTEHKFGTDWASDETGHFHACSVCGEKIEFAEHTPGAEATEETAQTCTVCAFEIAPALGHTHEFSEVWEKDGSTHWHVCACGEKADEAEHEWDENGVCVICLGQQPAEPAPAGDFPWIIVVIAVVGAAAVVVAIVLLKKKKK